MFGNLKKELLTSIVTAIIAGVFSFFVLQIQLMNAFVLSLFFMFLVMVLLYLSRKEIPVEKEYSSSTVSKDEYQVLEKKFQSALSKAEKLEKENKTTELFLASMSHEIRTPLNGIVGLTELLDGTELTEEQKEFVSMIRESSHNLNVIVNDILDVSKINAGKMELEHIAFDLFGKLEASVGMFVPKMEEKGITLNLFIDPRIPRQVIGDPTRLSQVVINLVSNAVKFTDKEGKIDLFAEYIRGKEGTVTFKISVSDSGIGLTKEQQERIFEAYSQAEASTTRKAGGTGLGLTISSKIVKSMGSELKVKSEAGEGATFFFTLTLPEAPEQVEKKPDIAEHLKVGVLFSDHNPQSQWNMILQKYIEYYGAEYRNYKDKNLLQDNCPDILLIDHTAMSSDMIEHFEHLSCKRVLMISGAKITDIKKERHIFHEVVYMPVTLEKIGKILQLKKTDISVSLPKVLPEERKADEEKKSFENIRVLVAEDNPINQKLIRAVLKKFGLSVTIASNGEEACNYRQKEAFDIIFMDIQMPVMGGVEATQHILEYEKEEGLKHVPIIALTANALSGDKEKYMAEGMDDYATKPLDIKVIEKLVSKYCEV